MRASIDVTSQEARTDELTGLPNRRALIEELERRSAAGDRFTLVLADLNGFKRYNDTFGHPAGDALLRRLGRRLAGACEGHGTAARLGGDEFCVLLHGDVAGDAAHALVRAALSDEGEGFLVTAATGLAVVPGDARDPSAALRLADSRMYAAKISGAPQRRAAHVRSADADARRAPPGPRRACRGGGRPGRGLRGGARPTRGRRPVDRTRRGAARPRQGRHPLRDPHQAGPAQRRRVDVHARPQHHRRAHPRRRPRPRARGADGARLARALGRRGLSRRAGRERRSRSAPASSRPPTPSAR